MLTMYHKNQRGFSLIELMVVVIIIGIIAMFAYPTYQNYITRSNRSAAQQFMLELANRNQQYLLDNRIYATNVGLLNMAEPPEVTMHYTITMVVDNAVAPRTMTITATPDKGTSQASDGALSINHIGTKTPADKW